MAKSSFPKIPRIGIYSGTFDPVHSGHIGFALQALKMARLDSVYFMPERRPRHKPDITHYAHRLRMLDDALKPYPRLHSLELPDRQFTVQYTLPRLTRILPDTHLILLMGSDVAFSLPSWPQSERLLRGVELVVGLRGNEQKEQLIEKLPVFPHALTLITSCSPHLSSSAIRRALRYNHPAHGLLASVKRYARAEWLYVSLVNE